MKRPHESPGCRCAACVAWQESAIQKLIGKNIMLALYSEERRWLQPTEEQLRTWEVWVIDECVRRLEEQQP